MDSSDIMRSLFSDMYVFRLTTPVRTNNNGPNGFWSHMIVWNHPLIEKVEKLEEVKSEELATSKFEKLVLPRKLETSLMMIFLNTMMG